MVNIPKLPSVKMPNFIKSVRYNLAAVTGVFVLTGVLLVIVGVIVLVKNTEYNEFVTNRFYTLPSFAVATGVLILALSCLGFYAALSEKFYFIAGYVGGLAVILIFEIALTIAAHKLETEVSSEIRPTMVSTLDLYTTRRDIAKIWDEMQMEFECCGVVGVTDWQSTRIPVSCCHIDYGTVSPFDCDVGAAYRTGCLVTLVEWLSSNAYVLAITALVVTCIQVVLTAFSAWLAWRSRFESVELES